MADNRDTVTIILFWERDKILVTYISLPIVIVTDKAMFIVFL